MLYLLIFILGVRDGTSPERMGNENHRKDARAT